ncbi:unnamed protein product [Bursaphelenchus okinawaensis]|uniref:SURF1-like protein n=1 Tax=Bursaphelenchus okinawaensis TaxID=465554 RepID=A0A811LIF4_9BILA|nr:unnamed protein product [Bursaphelenchus okinawaensis]CAG9126488.1 unnamed protein product [Bursaphelenchus okinawaensis]
MLFQRSITLQLVRRSHNKPVGRQPNIIKLNDRSGATKPQKQKRKFNKNSLGLLVIPASAFGLGVWQTQRLKWKEDLLAHLKEQLNQGAIPLPNDLGDLQDLEYRRVKVRGRYLYDRQFIIAPRGRFDEGFKDKGSSLIGDSKSSSHGGHFITPFLIEGTNQIIMVNRGWLPTEMHTFEMNKRRRNEVVEIEAIVRKSENRPQFVSANKPEKNMWFYKNFNEMGQHCGALPVLLDLAYNLEHGDEPISGQTNINLRNDHWNYLVTWYSLSAITLFMWYSKFLR